MLKTKKRKLERPSNTDVVLNKYSEFIAQEEKTASRIPNNQSSTDPLSLVKICQETQSNWMYGKAFSEEVNAWQTTLKGEHIDASNGSALFLAPETVEASLRKNITPVQLLEYTNHLPTEEMMNQAKKYFQSIGLIDNNTPLLSNVYDNEEIPNAYYGLIGHGTTELFSHILKTVIKRQGDVIIVTAPTYGLFIDPVLRAGGIIEPLVLEPQHDYKPQGNKLAEIIEIKTKKFQVNALAELAYVRSVLFSFGVISVNSSSDISNNNSQINLMIEHLIQVYNNFSDPLNYEQADNLVDSINRLLSEIKSETNDVFYSHQLSSLQLSYCNRVAAYYNVNPHMPYGSVLNQNEINQLAQSLDPFKQVVVIDDVCYFDLVLSKSQNKPGAFAKSSLKNRSLTLYGLSKQYGLAAVRSGIVLGSKENILPVVKEFFSHANMPSVFSDLAMSSVFIMKKQERDKYLNEIRTDYACKRDLAYALIEGVDKLPADADRNKIKKDLKECVKNAEKERELLKGIKDVRCVIYPESGYFLIIDLSKYQGQYLAQTQMNSSRDFYKALYALADVNTIPGELNLDPNPCRLRFSVSMGDHQIVEALMRLRHLLAALTPSLVLDNAQNPVQESYDGIQDPEDDDDANDANEDAEENKAMSDEDPEESNVGQITGKKRKTILFSEAQKERTQRLKKDKSAEKETSEQKEGSDDPQGLERSRTRNTRQNKRPNSRYVYHKA